MYQATPQEKQYRKDLYHWFKYNAKFQSESLSWVYCTLHLWREVCLRLIYLVYARAHGELRGVSSGRAYKSWDYRREICPPAELNTAVSQIAAPSRVARDAVHRTILAFVSSTETFPSGHRVILKSFLAQLGKRETNRTRAEIWGGLNNVKSASKMKVSGGTNGRRLKYDAQYTRGRSYLASTNFSPNFRNSS